MTKSQSARNLQELANRADGQGLVRTIGVPATELGIAFVWINRYNNASNPAVQPLAEYPDLTSLANAGYGVQLT